MCQTEVVEFTKVYVKEGMKTRSLCNDGTNSVYYIHLMNKTRWIIHLMGGGGCSTIKDCQEREKREKYLMSSEGLKEKRIMNNGIFSDDCEKNPGLCDVNKVLIYYCSSDRWSGDNDKSELTGEYYFHGRNIVMNTIKDLIDDYGLLNAEQIIVSGDSAGGEGIWNRGNEIGDLILARNSNIDFKILSGCGWFLNGSGLTHQTTTFEETVKLGSRKEFWNFQPDSECENQYINTPWLCLVGYLVYPFVKYDKMAVLYIFDAVQASYDGINYKKITDFTNKEREWINNRGKFVQNIIIEKVIVGKRNGLWAMGCYSHDILPQKGYLEYTTLDKITPAFAVADWINGLNSTHMDVCEDVINCNNHCTGG